MRSDRCPGLLRYLLETLTLFQSGKPRAFRSSAVQWVKSVKVSLAISLAVAARLWQLSGRAPTIRSKALALGCWLVAVAAAPLAEAGAPDVVQDQAGEEAAGELESLLRSMVLDAIPHQYEDERKWGRTKDIPVGLRVSNDGLRIRTKRRKRAVNHGTWKRYQVRLLNPGEEFDVELNNVRESDDGRAAFDVTFSSRLWLFGRLSQWQTGVQLISLSADAEAVVQLTLDCRLAMKMDVSRLPPDLYLEPEVVGGELVISEFRLNRISELRGPLARELSSGVRRRLEKEVAKRQPRLVERLNGQLDQHQDKLRISPHRLLKSPWARQVQPWLDAANSVTGHE